MKKITGKQSRSARALLKWNLPDLVTHTKVLRRRVDLFEKGNIQLQAWEMRDLILTYQGQGVVFQTDLTVSLRQDKKGKNASSAAADQAETDLSSQRIVIQEETDYLSEEDRKQGKKKRKAAADES